MKTLTKQTLPNTGKANIKNCVSSAYIDGFVHINMMLEKNQQKFNSVNNSTDPEQIGEFVYVTDNNRITSCIQLEKFISSNYQSSMAITTFALGIIINMAINMSLPVGIFSMGDDCRALTTHLLSSISRVNLQQIVNDDLDENERSRLSVAMKKLQGAPIYVDQRIYLDLATLNASAQSLSQLWGGKLGLLIIERIGLIQENDKRTEFIETNLIVNGLEIPIIALPGKLATIQIQRKA